MPTNTFTPICGFEGEVVAESTEVGTVASSVGPLTFFVYMTWRVVISRVGRSGSRPEQHTPRDRRLAYRCVCPQ